MNQHQFIVRLAEEPRAVELEVAAPVGIKTIGPIDSALLAVGAKALDTVIFSTSSHVILRAKLVESDGSPLDANRIGSVLEAIRINLAANAEDTARAA